MKTNTSPARTTARRRPRRRDPAAKRAQLMDSARELFGERGYAATTTADVARHAGVSEGIVFHHFGSKAELLEAVAADYGRGLGQAMDAAGAVAPPERVTESMLGAAFAFVRQRRELAMLLRAAPEPSVRSASRNEIVASIEAALRALHGAAHVRAYEPRIAAELLFALVEGALVECFFHGDGSRESEYLRETVACVEGALLARPEPTPVKESQR